MYKKNCFKKFSFIFILGLPWRKVADKDTVMRMKEDCRQNREQLFHGMKCKLEFGKIMEYVDSLNYEDQVDYQFIYEMLKTVQL